jgi:hypothetical protein
MSGSSGSHQLAGAHVSTKQMSGSSGSHQLAGAHVSVQLLFSRTRMTLLLWIKLRKVVVVVVVGKVDAQPCNGKHQTRHRTIAPVPVRGATVSASPFLLMVTPARGILRDAPASIMERVPRLIPMHGVSKGLTIKLD